MLGQAPFWLHNSGTVEAEHLAILDSSILIGGTFQQELQGKTARGNSDIFLYHYSPQQKLLGKYYIGGKREEQLKTLTAIPKGGWYGIGTFKDSLFFGEEDHVLYQNKTSVFVGKWQDKGRLEWARHLNSSGLVQVFDSVSDTTGALYLTGSFQDTLFLDDSPPLIASCTEAPFVLKIDPQGLFIWGRTSPICQEATGKSLALDGQGKLYWGGEFRGKLTMDSTFNRAHVVYRDLFLLTLETHTGRQLAQKQFMGVYDNQCEALKYYDNHLYIAGQFRGYLRLDSILLRTAFKTFGNAYVAKLDTNGKSQWAVQSSAFANAYTTNLAVGQQGVSLTGYYLDSIQWKNKKAGSIHKSEAFWVTFSLDGQHTMLKTGQGKGFDVARAVGIDIEGNTWLAGGFEDSILLGGNLGIAQGRSDAFIWRLPPNQNVWQYTRNTPLEIPTIIFPTIKLSPQPTKDSCIISVIDGGIFQNWQLYNTKGQLVLQGNNPIIPTKDLSEKVYSLHVQTSEGTGIEKLLIK